MSVNVIKRISSKKYEMDSFSEIKKENKDFGSKLISKEQNQSIKTISPKDALIQLWQLLVVVTIILLTVFRIYLATIDSTFMFLWIVVYFCDVVYLIDIGLNFFLAYPNENGILINNYRDIIKHYLKGKFLLDFLSIIPLDLLVFVYPGDSIWKSLSRFTLNRLIRFYRINVYFEAKETELGTNTALIRSLKYITICFITTHFITCGWFALACEGIHEGVIRTCKSGTWATTASLQENMDLTTANAFNVYIVSLYWAVATATSTGYGDISSVTDPEKWYSVFSMLAGITVFFGMLLGGMTSMLTNFDHQRARYSHRLEVIKKQLIDLCVPEDLTEQVHGYYEYLWVRKKGVSNDGIYSMLPMAFQTEISHTTNSSILAKAPIFDGLSSGFLRTLSMCIKPMLFLPQQIIITRGDVGHQMYFIHRGEVQVLSEDDDDTPVATLKSGKLFGEMSLMFSMPRTATLRAATHCDLMVLDKNDLNKILSHYPDILKRLQTEAKTRSEMAENLRNKDNSNSHYKATQSRKRSYISGSNRRSSFAVISQDRHQKDGIHHEQAKNAMTISESVEIIQTDLNELTEMRDLERSLTNNWLQIARHKLSKLKNFIVTTTLNPQSSLCDFWCKSTVITVLLVSFIYPYMACFTANDSRYGYTDNTFGKVLLGFTYFLDLWYFADVFIHLRTGVTTPYGLLTDFKSILKHYCLSWHFIMDLLSILPCEIFCFLFTVGPQRNHAFAYFRLNRLLKFYKVPTFFSDLEEKLDISLALMRSIKFMLYICLLSHWMACILYLITCQGEMCNPNGWLSVWAQNSRQINVNSTAPITEYITSLYWSVATMTSTGYGDISARTTIGRAFSLTAMLLGLFLYGYSLASMAATLANADSARVQFQEKLFAMKNFMKERHLGQDLKQRVMNYLVMNWEKHRGEWLPGQKALMHDMPQGLQQDIMLETANQTLGKVPLFKETEETFLKSLTLQTQPYLFSPGDIILYEGDMGIEMYCIRKGQCEIVTGDQKTVLAEIGPGQYFGEVGMIFGDRRTATVRAKTHVEVLMLSMTSLNNVLKEFPLLADQFARAKSNRKYLNELQEVAYDRQLAANNEEGKGEGMRKRHINKPSQKKFSKKSSDQELVNDYTASFKQLSTFQRIFTSFLMSRTFLPMGRFLHILVIIQVVIGVVVSTTAPIQAAFLHTSYPLWIFHYILDFFFYINLYIGFHVAFYNDDNILVTHPVSTAKNYLKTNFLIDLIACFPIELVVLAFYQHLTPDALHLYSMLRLNRVLQFYKLPLFFNYLESSVEKETGTVRLIKFGIYVLMFLNWLTAFVYILACPPNLSFIFDPNEFTQSALQHKCFSDSWILQRNQEQISNGSFSSLYSVSIYWATATAVSVGYGDYSASTDVEMLLSLCIMIIGILYFGYIIASVAAGMANADAQRARFSSKLSGIKKFMLDAKLNENLQKRVIAYYEYVWLRTRGVDPETLFDGLPLSLWGDVTLSLYEEIISKISLFKGAEISFIKMLSKCIKPMLFLKGEYVVLKHDIGSEMYFIHRGAVDVTSEDGTMIFDTMRGGASFGEVALLFSCPRTACIRARVNADVFMLTKSDLDRVLEFYPNVKKQVMDIAEERRLQAAKRSAAKINVKDSKASKAEVKKSESSVQSANDKSTTAAVISSVSIHSDENVSEADIITNEIINEESPSESTQNENANNPTKDKTENEIAEPVPLLTRLFRRFLSSQRFTLVPDSRMLNYYRSFMCVIRIITCWLVLLQTAYQDHHIGILIFNYICDAFFMIEIYINFHTSFVDDFGDLVEDFDAVFTHYLKRLDGFLLDFLAVFPFEVFTPIAPSNIHFLVLSYLRLTRLIRFKGISTFFTLWEKELNSTMLIVRLSSSVVNLTLMIHVFSCIWYMIACPLGGCNTNTWVEVAGLSAATPTFSRYCCCVYWTVATMTSTGYGDVHPISYIEMIFSCIVMTAGKLVFGFILGSIASTLSNAESARVKYDQNMKAVHNTMRDQNVPAHLQNRVINYFDYIWIRDNGVDPKALLQDAPSCLLAEVCLHLTRQMLDMLPLFSEADESFKRNLSMKINRVLFLPGDNIVMKGDMGKEVYYISQGEVEVLSNDDDTEKVDYILGAGNTFGEVSLVCYVPRQVSVRARTHVDLFTLDKTDLDEVLAYYPNVQESMARVAKEHFASILNEINPRELSNSRLLNTVN